MRIEQAKWTEAQGWEPAPPEALGTPAQLVLAFGATPVLGNHALVEQVQLAFPDAHVLGCSTSGEILGTQVLDDSLVVTAVQFDRTQLNSAHVELNAAANAFEAGERLAESLAGDDLVHVFVLSDGLTVNGSDLVRGLIGHLPPGVQVTGGLAGDGARFNQTLVFRDGPPAEGTIAALGFYGTHLRVGHGSVGGWDPFGPERLITRSEGNVLYELDGKPALDLYVKYLGDYANDLPASGLLFPLSLRAEEGKPGLVRTILAINREDGSMTFAGDIPEGTFSRLMKANLERLVDGAIDAAQASYQSVGSVTPDLAILISCVGRKLVLKQRVEEEVEGVRDVLGDSTALTGFYSYGEIAPFLSSNRCELHNQTMTITTLREE